MSALDEFLAMYGDDADFISDCRAELAQLRWRVAMLEVLDGDDGLIAANRLMEACERGDIPQQLMPDIQEARNEIVSSRNREQMDRAVMTEASAKIDELRATVAEQARQLEAARQLRTLAVSLVDALGYYMDADQEPQVVLDAEMALGSWLAANPAQQETQDEAQ